MNIIDLIKTGANVQLVISATDLREAFMSWSEEIGSENSLDKPENYLTIHEVSNKLRVDTSTLWRWDKSGYLKKIKIGGKIRYRESDVLKLMEG